MDVCPLSSRSANTIRTSSPMSLFSASATRRLSRLTRCSLWVSTMICRPLPTHARRKSARRILKGRMQVKFRLLKQHNVARLGQQADRENGQYLAHADTNRSEVNPAIEVGRMHLDTDAGRDLLPPR